MEYSKESKKVVTTTMSKAYQITVPSVVRKMLGLEPGDEVDFEALGDGVRISKAMSREEKIKRTFAELDKLKAKREKRMTAEQKKFAEMSKGWTVSQYHEHIDNLPETKKYIKEKYGVQVA